MQEGSSGYEFIVIEQGTAEVTRQGRPINHLAEGAFFGELAVLGDGTPRTASVTATSPVRGLAFTAHFMREAGNGFRRSASASTLRRGNTSRPTLAG